MTGCDITVWKELEGLIAEWREEAQRVNSDPQASVTLDWCADEVEAALKRARERGEVPSE